MSDQNFKNHGRIVPLYHGGTALLAFFVFVAAIIYIIYSSEDNFVLSILFAILSLTVVLAAFFARVFALKAQDRAIRAEERLRFYILTGKPMDPKLNIRQIIGLRFAPDAEVIALAERAVLENLTEKQIKQAVQNWKADTYRV